MTFDAMSPEMMTMVQAERPVRPADGIERVAASIRAAFGSTEDRFVEVGRNLESAIGILASVTQSFERLREELESDDLAAATTDLVAATTEIAALAGALRQGAAPIGQVIDRARAVGGHVARMRTTVEAVGMLAINAKIIMAHIANAEADFLVFAAEILRLARLAQDSLEGFDGDLAALLSGLNAASRSQTAFQARQAAAIESIAGRLARSVEAIGAQSDRGVAAASAVRQRSTQIRQQIGNAVMALQICDSTRQRLEHVDAAVSALARLMRAAPGHRPPDDAWWAALPADGQDAVAGLICRLQAAQIADAVEKFEREVDQVNLTLASLADDAREMVRLGTDAYGAADRGQGTAIQAMEAEVGEAHGLLAGYRQARAEADRVLASVAESVAGLVGHMGTIRSIEADIRLMGLNTTLKCSRLGIQGRPLAVVAQEMRAYAHQTAEDVAAAMAGLDEIAATAGAMTGGERLAEIDEGDDASAIMAASMARLRSVGGHLADALGTLAGQGQAVEGLLSRTVTQNTAHAEIGAALRQSAADLDAVAAGLPAAADGDAAEAAAALAGPLLTALAASYTMDAERAVHDRVVGGRDAAAIDAPGGAEADSDLDDILF